MTNEPSPAERYFDEARHRAAALVQPLRNGKVGAGHQEGGNRLRVVLANALPAQFGVASGTVVSSSRKLKAVAIHDALIYDQAQNSPLFQGIGEDLFPIETVLATVTRLRAVEPDTLEDLIDAIMPLRQMAQRGKFYHSYDIMIKPNGKVIANLRERRSDVPPRTYIVADSIGWERADPAAKAIKDALQKVDDSHLDGLLILDRDWFLHQPDNKHRIEAASEDGVIRFFQKMMADLSNTDMGALSAMRYAPE
jgi:hypothetical protein